MNPDLSNPVEAAWQLHNYLEDFLSRLWTAYDGPFTERCILEMNQPDSLDDCPVSDVFQPQSQPSQPVDDFDLDEIPF